MSLEALPAETLERIVTCIDAREDLINLSSVSHALNPIISERHLEYRDIRCHLNMDVLWEHLIANSDLAGNIRKLDIQPDGYGLEDNVLWPFPVRVPKRFLPEEQPVVETSSPPSDEHLDRDRRSETLLIFALKNMRNLTNFKWNRNPPLFDSLAGVGNEDIWTTLRSYTALLDLDVVDYSEFSPVHCAQADPVGFSYLRPIWDSAIFNLTGLISFKIETDTYNEADAEERPDMARLSNMLLSECPNLEVLHLSFVLDNDSLAYHSADGDALFTAANWPRLRVLNLSSTWCETATARRFLSRHPNIEYLRFTSEFTSEWHLGLPPNVLPHLTTLICDLALAVGIIRSLAEPRVLQTIVSIDEDDAPPEFRTAFIDLLGTLPQLKRLEFSGTTTPEEIKLVAEKAPHLTWLTIGQESESEYDGEDDWIDAFTLFPQISTIHGFGFVEEEPLHQDDPNLGELIRRLPALRRVDVWKDAETKGINAPVLMLKRDETTQSMTWEVEDIFIEQIAESA